MPTSWHEERGFHGGIGRAGEKLSALKELGGNEKKIDALVGSLPKSAGAAERYPEKDSGAARWTGRLRKRIAELEPLRNSARRKEFTHSAG